MRAAAYGCKCSDSALTGFSRETCVTVTSQRAYWHAVCHALQVIANVQTYPHEPRALETVPMARTRELTLLDVIQAVSEVNDPVSVCHSEPGRATTLSDSPEPRC